MKGKDKLKLALERAGVRNPYVWKSYSVILERKCWMYRAQGEMTTRYLARTIQESLAQIDEWMGYDEF